MHIIYKTDAKSSSEKLPVTFIPNQNTEIAIINNTSIKLTIAKYYLPTGRSIQAVGITPDIVVAEGEVPSGPQNQLEFKEADLKRHLKNELLNEQTKTDSKGEKTDSTNKDITEDIIMKDIQLKSAIDVLKTWGVISQANTTSIK